MPAPTEITNLPGWVVFFIGLASVIQVFSGLALVAIAIVLIALFNQLRDVLEDVKSMTKEADRHVPVMLGSVEASLKNVKSISDDATKTTHNVTGAIDKVAHLLSAVATKMESPAVKLVGAFTGVVAGMRALSGKKHEDDEPKKKKKRGLLGFFK